MRNHLWHTHTLFLLLSLLPFNFISFYFVNFLFVFIYRFHKNIVVRLLQMWENSSYDMLSYTRNENKIKTIFPFNSLRRQYNFPVKMKIDCAPPALFIFNWIEVKWTKNIFVVLENVQKNDEITTSTCGHHFISFLSFVCLFLSLCSISNQTSESKIDENVENNQYCC